MTEIIYKRGDPKTTQFVKQIYLMSGLIEATTHYYVTSTHWGDIVAELKAQYSDPQQMMDPTRPAPWGQLKNVLQIGNQNPILYVHNAGTEDEAVIYLLNNEQPKVEEFGRKRDALRTG